LKIINTEHLVTLYTLALKERNNDDNEEKKLLRHLDAFFLLKHMFEGEKHT